MPRKPRIRLAHVPFHVVQRGHNRQDCFRSDSDRHRYLGELLVLSRTLAVSIHAYVLMSNHVHLLLTPPTENSLPDLMRHLGLRYARHFNRAHSRSGAMWEGRYFASPVQAEGYLLACHRYIENNPVRAGVVAHAKDYRWSSHRANAWGHPDALLTAHPVLEGIAGTDSLRRRAYRALFAESGERDLEQIRNCTRSGFALGDQRFLDDLAVRTGRRLMPMPRGRPKGDRPKSDCVPI